MGKGDKKSKKGKIFIGSFGNSRLKTKIKTKLRRNASKKPVAVAAEAEEVKPKVKKAAKKKESAE